MRLFKYSLTILAALLLGACSSEEVHIPAGDNGSDEFSLDVSFMVPERGCAETRALGQKPEYADLKLYLVEFDLRGEPLENSLSGVYLAQEETSTPAGNPEMVTFKVTLRKSAEPKVMHLIAVPRSVEFSFGEYAMEGNIIPELKTSGGTDAYWQRVEFPDGYGTVDNNDVWQIGSEVKRKLTMVPMIRNFAQVSVNVTENATPRFNLIGYAIVNVPTAGTVAPWNSLDMTFPDYLDDTGGQKDYNLLDYKGVLAGDITDYNVDPEDFTNTPKYFYERPHSSVSHTQLLIAGNYNNQGVSYYKIDLGIVNNSNGVFDYYNLLRNFNYVVNITDVSASGYSSIEEAMNGVVYNNLSFDIDTQKMLNISNGTDMLWVNFTTAVITQDTDAARTLKFGFRYKKNITSGGGGEVDNSFEPINLTPGDVIESVREIESPSDSTDWKFYEIKTKAPSPDTKTQTFVVVNNSTGLGRTINLILRTPWEVTRNRVFAGNYNLPEQFPYNLTQYENVVGDGASAPLTVFFTIPENLPEAIFPLSFVLEADRQNIENNPVGTLVVTSGYSFFPNVTGTRIKYIKTITWSDYNTLLSTEYPTGVLVPDQNAPDKMIHRVRCRFRTITSLQNLGITPGESTLTTVRIYNPYFTTQMVEGTTDRVNGGNIEVKFTRTRGVALSDAPNY